MTTLRRVFTLGFLFASWLAFGQQQQPQQQQAQQILQAPVRPTCVPLFSGGACQSQWNQYQQAVAQYNQAMYQQRVQAWAQQQQAAAQQAAQQAATDAAAPLQRTIDAQKIAIDAEENRIKALNDQIEANIAADKKTLDLATTRALEYGIYIGGGGALLLFGLGFGIRRLTQGFSVVRRPTTILDAGGKE